MADSSSKQAGRRDESEEERLDRNLGELLQELRVVIPGIQFLFAFLLVVPFQQGWVDVTDFEKRVYYVTLLLTAASSVCLMAPTARHRIRFRDLDKEWIVNTSHKYAIAGMSFLALAIAGVILFVSHVVYGAGVAAAATAAVALAIGWAWFAAPLVRDLRDDRG
jgi:Family of unknown function (DUF6328)